jgi:hypothetical protein
MILTASPALQAKGTIHVKVLSLAAAEMQFFTFDPENQQLSLVPQSIDKVFVVPAKN